MPSAKRADPYNARREVIWELVLAACAETCGLVRAQ
jgi:hypothetical protein